MPLVERRKLDVGDIWLNRVQCLKCGQVITSVNRHDYVTCQCGNISVDGGSWYARRVGDLESYQEMSEMYDDLKDPSD